MPRALRVILHLLLVAAFVPVLALALLQPSPVLLVAFVPLAGVAWLSLRLGTSPRWGVAGLVMACAACGGMWSLAVAAAHVGGVGLVVP